MAVNQHVCNLFDRSELIIRLTTVESLASTYECDKRWVYYVLVIRHQRSSDIPSRQLFLDSVCACCRKSNARQRQTTDRQTDRQTDRSIELYRERGQRDRGHVVSCFARYWELYVVSREVVGSRRACRYSHYLLLLFMGNAEGCNRSAIWRPWYRCALCLLQYNSTLV